MARSGISLIMWLGVLALGCGDDGTTADTESGSGSDSGTMGMTSTPMMTSTTASMTTANDDTSTGEPPADTSTGEPPADSSTGEPPADSSGTADGDSSSSGGGGAAYPPCMPDADPVCPEPYTGCYMFSPPGFSVCTQECQEAADCPEPDGGTAVPVCGGVAMDSCVLDCSNDETCPDGMDCEQIGGPVGPSRCVWPNP